MFVLLVLVVMLALCLLLHDPIKRFPMVFYGAALALDAVFAAGCYGMLPAPVWDVLRIFVKEAGAAFSLFVIVMYIGVLPQKSRVRAMLMPIRGELSIMAFIVITGHAAFYLSAYCGRFISGSIFHVNTNALASLAVASALLALLLILGVTSFDILKKRMPSNIWKKVQRFSYAFYALVYVHVALMLGPAAISGRAASASDLIAYTVIFGLYFVLRVAKAVLDRSKRSGVMQSV